MKISFLEISNINTSIISFKNTFSFWNSIEEISFIIESIYPNKFSISIKFMKGDNTILGGTAVDKIQNEYEERSSSSPAPLLNSCKGSGGAKGCKAKDITDMPICQQVQADISRGEYPNLFAGEQYMPPSDGSGRPGEDYFPTNSFCRS